MLNSIIKKFIVHYGVNEKYLDYTHEWIYVKKKRAFAEESKQARFFKSRTDLYDSLLHEFVGITPFTYLEFGVYLGESLRYWVKAHPNPDSRFFGFDTFTGLPEDWTKSKPKGSYSANGIIPDINDERVEFEVGLFNETLPSFIKEKLNNSSKLIVHLDADLYSSTMYVLCSLLGHLKKGDLIMFDDFGSHLLHEFKAFIDFKTCSGIGMKLISYTFDFQQVAFIIE